MGISGEKQSSDLEVEKNKESSEDDLKLHE